MDNTFAKCICKVHVAFESKLETPPRHRHHHHHHQVSTQTPLCPSSYPFLSGYPWDCWGLPGASKDDGTTSWVLGF